MPACSGPPGMALWMWGRWHDVHGFSPAHPCRHAPRAAASGLAAGLSEQRLRDAFRFLDRQGIINFGLLDLKKLASGNGATASAEAEASDDGIEGALYELLVGADMQVWLRRFWGRCARPGMFIPPPPKLDRRGPVDPAFFRTSAGAARLPLRLGGGGRGALVFEARIGVVSEGGRQACAPALPSPPGSHREVAAAAGRREAGRRHGAAQEAGEEPGARPQRRRGGPLDRGQRRRGDGWDGCRGPMPPGVQPGAGPAVCALKHVPARVLHHNTAPPGPR